MRAAMPRQLRRTFAHGRAGRSLLLCVSLTENGIEILCAPAAMALCGTFQVGHQDAATVRLGMRASERHELRVCRRAVARCCAGTKEPTSISRQPASNQSACIQRLLGRRRHDAS